MIQSIILSSWLWSYNQYWLYHSCIIWTNLTLSSKNQRYWPYAKPGVFRESRLQAGIDIWESRLLPGPEHEWWENGSSYFCSSARCWHQFWLSNLTVLLTFWLLNLIIFWKRYIFYSGYSAFEGHFKHTWYEGSTSEYLKNIILNHGFDRFRQTSRNKFGLKVFSQKYFASKST